MNGSASSCPKKKVVSLETVIPAPPKCAGWSPDMKNQEAFQAWITNNPKASLLDAWLEGRLHYMARVLQSAKTIQNATIASLLRQAIAHDGVLEESGTQNE